MDLSEPKSGALVSLFSPSLYWMKTVIKLFSTGCRRVFSVDWKTSSGGGEVGRWGGGEVGKNWRGLEPGDDVLTTTRNTGGLRCIHVQWAWWVSKTIRQNRMGFSYIFSWSCQVWLLTPPFFPNVSTSSV